MRILVVDDVRSLEPTDGEVVYARTRPEGMARIAEGPWDVVYLDHDLGEKGDVRPVVTLLEERAFHGDPVPIGRVVVVTTNAYGANWIRQDLERHYPVRIRPAGPVIPVAESTG